jgi:cytochrome c5
MAIGDRRSGGDRAAGVQVEPVERIHPPDGSIELTKLFTIAACCLLVSAIAAPAEARRVPPGTEAEMRERMRPFGEVCLRGQQCGVVMDVAVEGERSGQQTYDRYCMACHTTGAAGAPMLGDENAWEPRVARGMDTLMQNTIQGIGAMPPMGTCMDCSEEELRASVEYLLDSLEAAETQAGDQRQAEPQGQAQPQPQDPPQQQPQDQAQQQPQDPPQQQPQAPPQQPAQPQQQAQAAAGRSGQEIYERSCAMCHNAGVAGAPMLNDPGAWAPRVERGMDTLMRNTIQGIGAMPPRGTCMDCSDAELRVAVEYMLDEVEE